MKKIQIAKLPQLKTRVGIQGSVQQKEVGSAVCAGIFIVIFS